VIDAPTLVIGCARDFVHPFAVAQRLASAIAGARLIEVVAKADDPLGFRDEVRAALAAFLSEMNE
jgi:pimeloyl-ACP methyl ester carboxylesterase